MDAFATLPAVPKVTVDDSATVRADGSTSGEPLSLSRIAPVERLFRRAADVANTRPWAMNRFDFAFGSYQRSKHESGGQEDRGEGGEEPQHAKK
jgi:hypothetical protein